MGIETIFAAAAADMMDVADTAATYTPTTGDPVSCQVYVMATTEPIPDGMTGLTWEQRTTIEALVADVGQPAKGSTFLVGSTTYTVVEITGNDGFFVRMAVK